MCARWGPTKLAWSWGYPLGLFTLVRGAPTATGIRTARSTQVQASGAEKPDATEKTDDGFRNSFTSISDRLGRGAHRAITDLLSMGDIVF